MNQHRISVGNPEGKTNKRIGRIIYKYTYLGRIGWNGINWIDLAQNMDQWLALLYTFGFNKLLGNSEATERLAAS